MHVLKVSAVCGPFGIAGAVVAGESKSELSDSDAPMITLNETTLYNYRPRERRLATATVWCISIANISDATLQSSLDWVCGPLANQGQVNCGPINAGGACYDPNTLAHHCDWAFNTYFQRMNGTSDSCNFGGTAHQVTTDPSKTSVLFWTHNNCKFWLHTLFSQEE